MVRSCSSAHLLLLGETCVDVHKYALIGLMISNKPLNDGGYIDGPVGNSQDEALEPNVLKNLILLLTAKGGEAFVCPSLTDACCEHLDQDLRWEGI